MVHSPLNLISGVPEDSPRFRQPLRLITSLWVPDGKGERSGRELGRALLREGPHSVVVELPRQLPVGQGVAGAAAVDLDAVEFLARAGGRRSERRGSHRAADLGGGALRSRQLPLPDCVGQVGHPLRRLRADRLQGHAARVHALEQADSGAEQHG